MFDHQSHYTGSHLDELSKHSKQTLLLQQALQTRPGLWDRLMVRLGSLLIALGSKLQKDRLYTGLLNHRA